MARYRMSDGMVVDTKNASNCIQEVVSVSDPVDPEAKQWGTRKLYRSRRGRWYVVNGTSAEWVSNEEACRLLLLWGEDPERLKNQDDFAEVVAGLLA